MTSTVTPNESLRRALLARYPLIFVRCAEDDRVRRYIRSYRERLIKGRTLEVVEWSCTRGLSDQGPESADPIVALKSVFESKDPGFFVFFDLTEHLSDPRVRRTLREGYDSLRGTDRFLFFTGTSAFVPEDLERQVHVLDFGLPDVGELRQLVDHYAKSYDAIHPEWAGELSFAMKGLTLAEAGHSMQRSLRLGARSLDALLEEVAADKSEAVHRAGFLEYVPQTEGLDGIGGLENLKDWLLRREQLFSREAVDAGMPVPKGMLVMGMSGCGKSLAAKSVSALWKVPLFRLDMNLIASGIYGTPEAAFAKALRTVESLAPAVLWIDEIENSLSGETEGQYGNAGIFSSFLTWMQEKPPMIFVAATANRISALPAEVIRKGRFDQVFFVDLPTPGERQAIFDIHLRRYDADPGEFDLELLAIATKGWNGAEIEEAVKAARIDAYQVSRPFVMADVTRNTSTMVPLSKTMHEQMKRIRGWAYGRAALASAHKYNET